MAKQIADAAMLSRKSNRPISNIKEPMPKTFVVGDNLPLHKIDENLIIDPEARMATPIQNV